MESYKEMRDRQQSAFNAWTEKNAFFAFSDDQFREGCGRMGITPEEGKERLFKAGDSGMFYLKAESAGLRRLVTEATDELYAALEADSTGDGFIFDMLTFEMFNHEYALTGNDMEILEACGLSLDELDLFPQIREAWPKAAEYVMQHTEL